MSEKKKEKKYLVLKLEDIENGLWPEAKDTFWNMVGTINTQRHRKGKKDNRYVVVNEEEPYSEKVWDMILGRVRTPKQLVCVINLRDEKFEIYLEEDPHLIRIFEGPVPDPENWNPTSWKGVRIDRVTRVNP